MLRKVARERREFIYRKSIEDREKIIASKKEAIRAAVDDNKSIPTSLKKEALGLHKSLEWDDEGGQGVTSHIDDEYKWAGCEDPRILITTSRDPSSRLKQFSKEIKLLFPNSRRINRGGHKIDKMIEACIDNDVTDFILLTENRGEPDGMIISHLPHGPTAYFTLAGTIMRHDIPDVGTMSEEYPHLFFNNFTSSTGKRVMDILKYLFPVPKPDAKRTIGFGNYDDTILFFHWMYRGPETKMKELGPRFQMRLFKIILGTIDKAASADVEWVYRPYMRTAKKRKFLSDD